MGWLIDKMSQIKKSYTVIHLLQSSSSCGEICISELVLEIETRVTVMFNLDTVTMFTPITLRSSTGNPLKSGKSVFYRAQLSCFT